MLIRFIASALALAVATWLLPGISVVNAEMETQVFTLIAVAAIFGVVNSIVKPLFKIVTAPVIFFTLGLALWVINAVLLMLVSWLAGVLGLHWHVDDWGSAFLGALIVSVVSLILNAFFGKRWTDHR